MPRLTDYPNGVDAGIALVADLQTSEPTGILFSDGVSYATRIKAGGTKGIIWLESNGIHYNTNGTEYTVPLTSTSGSNSLDVAYDVGSSITVDAGAVTLTDPTTGSTNTLAITKSSTNTGSAIDIDMDASVGGKAIAIDAGGGARTDDLIQIDLDGTFSATGGGTVLDLNISQTGASASPAIDIDVSSVYTGNLIDIAYSAAATGIMINADMNANLGGQALYIDCGAGTRTAEAIGIKHDGDGDVAALLVTATNTGSADIIDIDIDGIHTGNAIGITYGTASATGDALAIDMGTAVGGSAITIAGAGARTDDLIKIDDTSTSNSPLIDINVTGNRTGDLIDISLATSTVAGDVLAVDMDTGVGSCFADIDSGGGTRTVDLFDIKHDGDGNVGVLDINNTNTGSGNTIDISTNSTGSGNMLNIGFVTAAHTGHAVNLDMDTNVTGIALLIDSSATGTASEGSAIHVVHDGNLAANADLMRLVSSGSHNAASNLLYIEGSGASNAGTYAVNINASGTNIEALKVDAGGVVFDETLSVAGATTMTGTLTVGVDGTGLDVKFFGDTASAYMLWDESADDLVLAGAAGLSVAGATTLTGLVTCAAGLRTSAVARTGTVTGETTGQIAEGTSFVDLTVDGATKVVGLPQGTLGDIIYIMENNNTGFEIRPKVADKATTTINGGDCSSDEEVAIGAADIARCICTKSGAAGNWMVSSLDADGGVTAGGTPD